MRIRTFIRMFLFKLAFSSDNSLFWTMLLFKWHRCFCSTFSSLKTENYLLQLKTTHHNGSQQHICWYERTKTKRWYACSEINHHIKEFRRSCMLRYTNGCIRYIWDKKSLLGSKLLYFVLISFALAAMQLAVPVSIIRFLKSDAKWLLHQVWI